MLGISTYLQDLSVPYLKKAAEVGAKFVFSSFHIPEEDFSNINETLPLLIKTCQENHLQLVPDVSPVTFEKLNIPSGDTEALKKLGIQALRLDYGFNDISQLEKLQKDFQLFLNASVINEGFLAQLMASNLKMEELKFCHNFYPKGETGLSEVEFLKKNQIFSKLGLSSMAFVTGDVLKRFPLYEGLPTLEIHRGKDPYVAAVELMEKFGVTDICIGDSEASIATLEMIETYMKEKIMTLPAHFTKEYQHLYEEPLKVRPDLPEKIIRLSTPRIPEIPIGKTANRKKGTITMDNSLAGRYSGEINLCKEDLPFKASANTIGFIAPVYLELLHYVNRDTRIKFIPIEMLD